MEVHSVRDHGDSKAEEGGFRRGALGNYRYRRDNPAAFSNGVNLIYIDPPFDSGADYVRKVSLRGAKGTAKLDGETYTLGEQIQYTDIWANDKFVLLQDLECEMTRLSEEVTPMITINKMLPFYFLF